nr:putative receptor-like protein kinase At3g47110 [Quercus suber]
MTLHQTKICAFCSIHLRVILLFFASSLLCLQPVAITATAPTNETDRLALLKFKEFIPHDPYKILSSWNGSLHFCNWHGITCGRRHQRVTGLDLQGYNLGGSISLAIGNLSFLRFINLQNNSFYGKIPQEFGHLFRLQRLQLNNNTLGGEIPSNLSICSNLRSIRLHENKLTGKIPEELGSLMRLQNLTISTNNLAGGNQLNGTLPANIGLTLPNLQLLLFGENMFYGPVPTSLCNATQLQMIELSRNNFLGSVPKKSKKKSPSMFSTMDLLPSVSYQDLYNATCGFSPDNLIGSGSFGSVYKGTLDQEEKLVAIKVLNLQHKGAFKSFMAECNALRIIRHRNLVKILTCCSSTDYSGNQFKALVFEFMANGSLDIWLHPELDNENQSRNLSLLQRINVALDVASAIDYLHNYSVQPIIHCDLKPSNVLLDKDMVAHVSDFGLAKLLSTVDDSSENQTSTIGIKGTIGYAAPEYGMGDKASIEGDVYSYGILLLEMFIGKRPTDEMFKDGLNLHNFAKMGLPKRVVQIVDPILLPKEVDVVPTAIVAARNDNEIQVDEGAQGIANLCQMDANVQKCLVSILEIGLACSIGSPKERMKMKEVTSELHMIKKAFLGSGILLGGLGRIYV